MATFVSPLTTITVEDDGAAPEQVASDLIRAAFSALGAVQARDDFEQRILAACQSSIAVVLRELNAIRPVV